MFAIGTDHPSEPTSFGTGRRIPTIVRRVLARRKSISALLYMISAGLIATWIIGVFFGLGFFLLIHEPQRSASGPDLIDQPGSTSEDDHTVESATGRLTDLPMRLGQPVPDGSVKPPQSSGKEAHASIGNGDPSSPAPQNQNTIPIDRPGAMSAEPGKEQTGVERDSGVPSVDVGTTFGSLGEVVAPRPLPRGQPSGVIEQRRVPPHSAKAHKRHQRRPPVARTPQPHAPVQAIQDVLEKLSRLLR
jgi:hypothetical protein